MTRPDHGERTGLGRWLVGWLAALLILPTAVVAVGLGALHVAGTLVFSTERNLKHNWGIVAPDGVRVVEHIQEESFHGDGFRITVFEVEEGARLADTFFDVSRMSDAELTDEQVELVTAATAALDPENALEVPRPGLRHAELVRGSQRENTLLSLHDESTRRFYVYESFV